MTEYQKHLDEHDESFRRAGFSTRAIHVGQAPDPATGAVVPPITLASTFAQRSVGELIAGFEYSRSGNPTRHAWERAIASLEGGEHGLAFASGLAAEDVVLRTVALGGHVMLGNDAYGGTLRMIDKVHRDAVSWSAHDMTDIAALEAGWVDGTSVVWLETPSNPWLHVADIRAVATLAHARDALVVVDNTFATPYLQQPLALGADVVVHSATKYLGGHSDVVGGVVVTNDAELAERLSWLQNAAGAVPAPFDCYMALRGIKTLAVRIDAHSRNAQAVAEFLATQPHVSRVLYPGLPDHPNHDVAARQMSGFGGMVSVIVDGGKDAALEVVSHCKVFTLAESLGAVESLIEHPAAMTHASATGTALEVDPGLIRLSVGIENTEDLIADLAAAFRHLDRNQPIWGNS